MRRGLSPDSRVLRGCSVTLFTTMFAVVFLLALVLRVAASDGPLPNRLAVEITSDDDNILSAAKNSNEDIDLAPKLSRKDLAQEAPSKGSSVDLLKQLDDLMSDDGDADREKALELCRQNYNKYKNDPEFMWRFVKALYIKSTIEENKKHYEQQKTLSFEAKHRGEEALALTSNNGNVLKWYLLAVGTTFKYWSQIKIWLLSKDTLEKAIKLRPDDPTLYYMMGRWYYKAYNLEWYERKIAIVVFGTPLSASIDDALDNFLKSDRLRTKQGLKNEDGMLWDNYLYIAKVTYPSCS